MSRLLVLGLVLAGCDTSSLQWASEGRLEVDGNSCVIDAPTAVGFGFCLDSDETFAVSGDGDCGDVTVWLDGTVDRTDGEVTYDVQANSTALEGGLGTVWLRRGGESWTSTSGTATLLTRSDGNVAVSFEVQLETLVGGDPGPTASGVVLCEDG